MSEHAASCTLDKHRAYIEAARLGSGWAAVHYVWDTAHGGFWDVWDTGVGRYATKEEAEVEARDWALAEDIEYRGGLV